MTTDQPSPAAEPAPPMAPEHPADPDATESDATESDSSGGQVSEGPSGLSTAETSGGGADAVPDTHG